MGHFNVAAQMNLHLARIAYETFCRSMKWDGTTAQPMPNFEHLPEKAQQAWYEAADAVAREVSSSRP
jgi:hypothetical protein